MGTRAGRGTQALLDVFDEPAVVLGPEGVVESVNRAFLMGYGLATENVVGRSFFALDGGRWNLAELRKRVEAAAERDEITENHRFDGVGSGQEHGTARINVRRVDPAGRVAIAIATGHDPIPADRQTVPPQELRHQFRNAIALVEVLGQRTLLDSRDYEHFRQAYSGRLRALTRVYGKLLDPECASVKLHEFVSESLDVACVDRARVALAGPDCDVARDQLLGSSLALHELGTNARRHGALSGPRGQVTIRWSVDKTGAEDRLRLIWQESDGPSVRPPARRGYGLELIDALCKGELAGDVSCQFQPPGFACELWFPLRSSRPESH